VTTRAETYRAKAADCERQAHEARDAAMKKVLEDVARSWMRLARFLDEGALHQTSTFAPNIRAGDRGRLH
jgi:hypothetical protein